MIMVKVLPETKLRLYNVSTLLFLLSVCTHPYSYSWSWSTCTVMHQKKWWELKTENAWEEKITWEKELIHKFLIKQIHIKAQSIPIKVKKSGICFKQQSHKEQRNIQRVITPLCFDDADHFIVRGCVFFQTSVESHPLSNKHTGQLKLDASSHFRPGLYFKVLCVGSFVYTACIYL